MSPLDDTRQYRILIYIYHLMITKTILKPNARLGEVFLLFKGNNSMSGQVRCLSVLLFLITFNTFLIASTHGIILFDVR